MRSLIAVCSKHAEFRFWQQHGVSPMQIQLSQLCSISNFSESDLTTILITHLVGVFFEFSWHGLFG